MTCTICGVSHSGVKDGVCTRPSCLRAKVTQLTQQYVVVPRQVTDYLKTNAAGQRYNAFDPGYQEALHRPTLLGWPVKTHEPCTDPACALCSGRADLVFGPDPMSNLE